MTTPPTALATTTCRVCGESILGEEDGYEIVLRLRHGKLEQAVVSLCVKCGYRVFERIVVA